MFATGIFIGLLAFTAPTDAMPVVAAVAVADPDADWPGSRLRPKIFEAWMRRIDSAGGVYPWNRRYANGRVFQAWAALLAGVQEAAPSERQRMGQRLRDYVLGGPMLPLGRPGTTLPLPGSEVGDFDMALIGCVSLLGLFENDSLLIPNDVFVHLLKTVNGLFGQASQEEFEVGVLRFPETENHVFMTEGCRLLSNEMLLRNARQLPELMALRDSLEAAGVVIDNQGGPLRKLLLKAMAQILKQGFFEFNARVYQRFTVHALLNLHAFSHDSAVRDGAAITLDYLGALFALQSCEGVRWGPYRRSSEAYDDSSLYARDAVASFFAVHSGVYPWDDDPDTGLWRWNLAHAGMALWATLLPYRPPTAIRNLLRGDKGWYEAHVASGNMLASRHSHATESYAGGPGFVLSAGGPFEAYGGANFPTPGRAFEEAPWVYDVLNRPAALLWAPTLTQPRVLKDLLHLRGSMWRAPAAKVQGHWQERRVVMQGLGDWGTWSKHTSLGPGAGVNPGLDSGEGGSMPDTVETPWHWPSQWDRVVSHTAPRTVKEGNYVDAFTLSAPSSSLPLRDLLSLNLRLTWPEKPQQTLREKGLNFAALKGLFSTPSRSTGTLEIEASEETHAHDLFIPQPDTLPFVFPLWRGWEIDSLKPSPALCRGQGHRLPHVQGYALGDSTRNFVCVDGAGHFYAFHAPSGAYTVANFSLWWRPLRRVFR